MAMMLCFLQPIAQARGRPPVAVEIKILANDKAGNLRFGRFNVVKIDTVVSDERIGHRHDLSRVRRVGEDLLVAGDTRIENNLAGNFSFGAEIFAGENCSVLECKLNDH